MGTEGHNGTRETGGLGGDYLDLEPLRNTKCIEQTRPGGSKMKLKAHFTGLPIEIS